MKHNKTTYGPEGRKLIRNTPLGTRITLVKAWEGHRGLNKVRYITYKASKYFEVSVDPNAPKGVGSRLDHPLACEIGQITVVDNKVVDFTIEYRDVPNQELKYVLDYNTTTSS